MYQRYFATLCSRLYIISPAATFYFTISLLFAMAYYQPELLLSAGMLHTALFSDQQHEK
jgi:hypothetical protein